MEHHTQAGIGDRPVTVEYDYSTLAWLPEKEGIWVLPLRHLRGASRTSYRG